jgi:hypothetical protein
MAETTADVRRDIELTRERMTSTLAQLEQKLNLTQIIRDNPWPAIGLAVGAGVLLSGSRADVKAAAATAVATRGASSRIGTVLDDVVANVMTGLHEAFSGQMDKWVNELKTSLGAPTDTNGAGGSSSRQATGTSSFSSAGASPAQPGAASASSATPPNDGGMSGSSGSWAPHTATDMSAGSLRAD